MNLKIKVVYCVFTDDTNLGCVPIGISESAMYQCDQSTIINVDCGARIDAVDKVKIYQIAYHNNIIV
jgi:hypothetical protein